MTWVTGDGSDAQIRGQIFYNVCSIDSSCAQLRLVFRIGERVVTNAVAMEATSPNFGGRRWWFDCPKTGRRSLKLYLPPGEASFACRKFYRLAYTSQRQSVFERALRRARKTRQKLGQRPSLLDPFPPKPPRIWWKTYSRMLANANRDQRLLLQESHSRFAKLQKRLAKAASGDSPVA